MVPVICDILIGTYNKSHLIGTYDKSHLIDNRHKFTY